MGASHLEPRYVPCKGHVPCQPVHLPPHVLAERMEVGPPCTRDPGLTL